MKEAVLRRACKISLRFATGRKRHEIAVLLEAYRGAVNFYLRSLWVEPGKWDAETSNRLPIERTRLQRFQRDDAFKQAFAIVGGTRKAEKAIGAAASCPRFDGYATLLHGVTVEIGRGSFDLVVKLSTIHPGARIAIPTRRTAVLNKWLAMPGARIVQGCALTEREMILWVEFPEPPKRQDGDVLGVDVGINKLLATSEGEIISDDWKPVSAKIRRRRAGSKRKHRARIARDHFINRAVKQLPWHRLAAIGIEDLIGLKRGKSRSRGKNFRKAASPWTYRRVRQRIEDHAAANRVRLVCVDPRGTSRTCPECGEEDRRNRQGQSFRCIACDHTGDADIVGARNIRQRTLTALGSVLSPRLRRA